jgi:NAD(P)-dependent dehydrogenase (short-subunit alcohol dehydrogenase family)
MDRLKGKVAIVTGAAVGLGRAVVTRMTKEGTPLAVLDVLATEGDFANATMGTRHDGLP